ncbi:hypothetical protein ACWT_0216 [Actinoplanes sp. SE50]|uniref:hypothetical protein n=1 Tax=unclassified Actinoplanes TaxID=2626549 RepID=UPI00023EBC7C|nr:MULTISPECIES: hypothetical protein [unclassified Actinoplanes]AEV81228.1 hypothetical protein ACPL_331 [Actinoplanes sp. SE50/110]ATO79631.1 hypothetical protein ACWT_0216 [Actinoplanes sp. SE50]SLL97034.1 hypothetical protein ACSP50_0230 [Actinoplanes sp. SE50/110]
MPVIALPASRRYAAAGGAIRSPRASVAVWRRGRVAAVWRLLRLLLIAGTALGVATLHTLGHTDVGLDEHRMFPLGGGQALTTTVAVLPGIQIAAADDDGGCDGDGCTQSALVGTSREAWHSWQVCQAILSPVAVAVAVTATRPTPIAGSRRPSAHQRTPVGQARAPVGLTLASTAVLRT